MKRFLYVFIFVFLMACCSSCTSMHLVLDGLEHAEIKVENGLTPENEKE